MKLFLLKYPNGTHDQMIELIVRAKDEARARKMAAAEQSERHSSWQGANHWLDPQATSCEVIDQSEKEEVLCVDYYEA